MPGITLDLSDATEIAETLTLLTQWLSGSQQHILAESFGAFIGHPGAEEEDEPAQVGAEGAGVAGNTKTSSASRRNDQQYRSPAFPT